MLSLPIGVLYFVFPSFYFVFSVILDWLLVGSFSHAFRRFY
ncbi:MAG: hypothetical protein RXQ75_05415 [Acidianus hospitalis]|nr:hypothetical protein [Acidianus hospitalis]